MVIGAEYCQTLDWLSKRLLRLVLEKPNRPVSEMVGK